MNDKSLGANIHKLSATLSEPGRIQSSGDFQQYPILSLSSCRSFSLLAVARFVAAIARGGIKLPILYELDASLWIATSGVIDCLLDARHRDRQM